MTSSSPPTDPLRDHTRRGVSVRIWVTPAERDQLAEVARDMALPLSSYLRRMVLDQPLPPPRERLRPIPEVNRETYVTLGRLGSNLNQIARRMNEHRGGDGDAAAVLKVLDHLADALVQIRTEVIGAGHRSEEAES
jgi:non-ribosomal peptide synthetase component F